MGAALEMFIEFDDSDAEPFTSDIDGVIDFSNSISITHCKPYELMQAIAGVRGDESIKPFIAPRGFPQKMTRRVGKHIEDFYGPEYKTAGWLHYSELMACLKHANLDPSTQKASIQLVFEILRRTKEVYGDDRVRLIFMISSP